VVADVVAAIAAAQHEQCLSALLCSILVACDFGDSYLLSLLCQQC
jgi:hypothetical protein